MTAIPTDRPVDRVLGLLDNVRRSGAGWTARCPGHEDRQNSLSVGEGAEARVLLHCFAGCDLGTVLSALGIADADLFAADDRPGPLSRTAHLARRARTNGHAPAPREARTEYAIRDPNDGSVVAIHTRIDLPDGTKRYTWPKGTKTAALPLYRPTDPGDDGKCRWSLDRPVVVVEGEKTAEAVHAAGLQAAGTVTGSAGLPSPEALLVLAGCDVVLWPDADDGGRQHMRRIAALLADVAASVRVVHWPEAAEHGDAADVSAARVRELVEAADAPAPTESAYPEPEQRSRATLSPLGEVWYVEDLIRPGRIHVVAAEEGTGKSMAIDAELGIRMAIAGGSFAGTWPILRTGPVLYLSEMHSDDDFDREEMVLAALERDRSELDNLYRLSLATAAGGKPALQDEGWRAWITEDLRARAALLLIFDTATGAARIDPWGDPIQELYQNLRIMLDAYPELAIVLIVHLKKPQGRGGERRISDVLGEWGRWTDVLLLIEEDGLTRVKLTTRKRVRRERRIVATKRDGLLVDPVDLSEASTTKVPIDDVVEAIRAEPGITASGLATKLHVTVRTAQRYAHDAESAGRVLREQDGAGKAYRYRVDEVAEQLRLDAEAGS